MAIDNRTGRQLACKIINLRSIREKEMARARGGVLSTIRSKKAFERRVDELTARVLREVDIMKGLSHVSILTNIVLIPFLTET